MLAAGAYTEVGVPAELADPSGGKSVESGERWLTVRAELAADTAWAPAGHVVAWSQRQLSPAAHAPAPWPAAVRTCPELVEGRLGRRADPARASDCSIRPPATFASWLGLPVSGPRLELWRGPTDNDRSDSRGSYELGTPETTRGEGAPGPSSEARWRERGLDRLVTRVLSVDAGAESCTVATRVGVANGGHFVDVSYRWRTLDPDAVVLRVEVSPSPGWDSTWPRVGVHLELPAELGHADWFGTGPLESYPDTRTAARVGRFSASVDELNVALLATAGDRPPRGAAATRAERAVRTGAGRPDRARPRRPPPRIHPDPAHTAPAGRRATPVRAADRRKAAPLPGRRRPRRRVAGLRYRRTASACPVARSALVHPGLRATLTRSRAWPIEHRFAP